MHPNVLLVGNFLGPSLGIRTVGEDLAAHLVSWGYGVRTTSSQRRPAVRLIDMVGTVLRQRRGYEVAQIDVFSGSAFIFAETVGTLLDLLRKPYVLTLHGGNLPAFGRRWPRRVGRLLRRAAAVTTPSRYLFHEMKEYRGDIQLVPNAVDVGAYPFHVRAQPRPRCVWLRAFHRMYNPALAPAVLAELTSWLPDARLTMIGPDKGDGSLEETRRVAATHRVGARIAFPGAVPKPEVPRWLASHDVFLNTTDVDNAPVSVVEAMAAGLCIVSTNVGGIPYLLEDGHDALLVPPRDARAMATAVRRVFEEPRLAEQLSRNARAKAESFDWTRISPQWQTLLTAVADRRIA